MPSRQPLTRTGIAEAAIRVADAEGERAVRMRRVAAELDVEAMSLYNHVANKEDLFDAMVLLLLTHMPAIKVRSDEKWPEILRAMCWSYRELIVSHPHIFASQGGNPRLAKSEAPVLERIVAVLINAGFPQDAAHDFYLVGSSYTRGFALTEIAQAASETPPNSRQDVNRAFDRGITALIAGFNHYAD